MENIIGNRIKERRKARSMSANKLAKILNVTEGAVRHWENGRHKPDNDHLLNIAIALKTTRSYLLGESDDPSPKIVESTHAFRIAVETEPLTTDQKLDKILAVLEDISRKLDKLS